MIKHLTVELLAAVVTAVAAIGAPAIEIAAGPGDLAGEFAAGQVVSVPLYVASACDAGVFGVELVLSAASSDFVIRTVTFDPAFSQVVGDVSPAVARAAAADASAGNAPPGDAAAAPNALPGRQYRAVRSQAVGTLDRTLGADGAAVPFATVELEITNSRPFASALVVHYRGSVVGSAADADGSDAPDGESSNGGGSPGDGGPAASDPGGASDPAAEVGRLVVEIVNTAPEPAPERNVEVWTQQQASLTVNVRDPATSQAVTTLLAGAEYDLYYDTHGEPVTGYVLFAVADEPGHGLRSARAPRSGDWAGTGAFAFAAGEPASADGYPAGMARYASISDDLMAVGEAAGPSGWLLSFTPEGPGPLNLQLFMRNIDVSTLTVVEMEARLQVNVE